MRNSEPKPHWINKLASVLSIPKFETWLRKMLRTSESGHWTSVFLCAEGEPPDLPVVPICRSKSRLIPSANQRHLSRHPAPA
jgi:hypothetical protein